MTNVRLQAIIVPLALILIGVFLAFFKQANIVPLRLQARARFIGIVLLNFGCALGLIVWFLTNFMNLSVWWALR